MESYASTQLDKYSKCYIISDVTEAIPKSFAPGEWCGVGFSGFSGWWPQAASVLPLLVLVSGLLLIDNWVTREQVLAAAEIDAQLLSDTLPPTAYSDPGFAEYLRSSPQP